MIKNKDKIMYILLVYAIICMIIGSFFDLSINQRLYAHGDIFPNFFKITAEVPMVILMSSSSLIYLKNKKNLNNIFKVLLLIISIAFPIVSSTTILSYFGINNIFYSLGIFLTYIIIVVSILNYTNPLINDTALDYCLFIICSIISIFIVFNLMKNIWGRQRFFSIYYEQNFSLFTDWWKINGFPDSDAFKSFPSGHTSSAATSLVLIYFNDVFNIKNKFIKVFSIVFPVIFTISTQYARIMDGAHYLTDVSMALILSVILILFMKNKFIKKHL